MTSNTPLFGGVSAAAPTPMNADLSADITMLADYCRWLLSRGCNSVGLLGSTGEANSFSGAERKAILEGVIASGIPARNLLPSTGCCSISETVELSLHAAQAGCTGVLSLPPFFYKSPSDDGLFDHFAKVVEGTKGKIAIYLYNFPQQSTIMFSLTLIERLLEAFPGIFRGIKDSGGNYAHTKAMIDKFSKGGFEVLTGSGEFLLQAMRDGGAGCITAAANVNSSLSAIVYVNPNTVEAEEASRGLAATRNALKAGPSIPTLKEIVARGTGNDAWRRMRPPHRPLAEEQADRIWAALEECGGIPDYSGLGR